jgi:pimeloyl-ACP methyl ester carboxylesterase
VDLNYHRSGSGEPLVLIHGIGSRWQMWEPVLTRLRAHRDVIAIDLPGFAASPMPPDGTPAGIDSLASLVTEFLTRIGVERPHVAGNSLGGWLALELARRGTVRSAAALSPAGFQSGGQALYSRLTLWTTVRLARLLAPYADRLSQSATMRKLSFNLFLMHPERLTPEEAAESSLALARAPWFDETLRAVIPDSFSGGEKIEVPVTVAWGEKDRLLLPSQAYTAAIAIPRARLVLLRGCGHVPTYDDPGQVASVLLGASLV